MDLVTLLIVLVPQVKEGEKFLVLLVEELLELLRVLRLKDFKHGEPLITLLLSCNLLTLVDSVESKTQEI